MWKCGTMRQANPETTPRHVPHVFRYDAAARAARFRYGSRHKQNSPTFPGASPKLYRSCAGTIPIQPDYTGIGIRIQPAYYGYAIGIRSLCQERCCSWAAKSHCQSLVDPQPALALP